MSILEAVEIAELPGDVTGGGQVDMITMPWEKSTIIWRRGAMFSAPPPGRSHDLAAGSEAGTEIVTEINTEKPQETGR